MRILIIFFGALLLINPLFSQENAADVDRLKSYKLGQSFFDQSLYGPSRYILDRHIDMVHPAHIDDFNNLHKDAEVLQGIAGLRMDLVSGENDLLSFVHINFPDPITTPAILELGSYYYNQKWSKKATEMYAKIILDQLPEYDMSEASFKKGYSHFVMKEFAEGKHEFARTKDIQNDFYFPANYYYGVCYYFLGNYANAVSSFEKVSKSPLYKSFVPYYITQIYFAQKQYDKVITFGEQSLKDSDLRNRKEIRLLLGQSYFKNNDYTKALPHLEFYEANTEKLTIEEFYQLGFTQYQLKKYNDAKKNFLELNLLDSKLGQLVNYYLADCYQKTGDAVSARAAFKKVSQMNYEKSMQEESTFNYGKLSTEAGFEREAINTLVKIDKSSKYYTEANNIVNDILENTSDFASAIQIIDELPSQSDKLKSTYQLVALKYGIQLYNNGDLDGAKTQFEKSKKYQINKSSYTQASFWIAQILNEKKETSKSIIAFNEYFDLSNGQDYLPFESSPHYGHYTQAYNYLSIKDYKNAEKSFKNSIVGFNINEKKSTNVELSNKVLTDAYMRTGDCLFKNNQYKDAMVFYDKAIQRKQGNYIYAMYQKAMIEGLLGEPYEKILTLLDIKKGHPNSEYADDALLQLGDTYFSLDNVDNAYNSFTTLVNDYKNSPLKNAAYLKLGLIAYNKGDMNAAISHYKNVFKNNPSSKESESALLGLQEIYINDLGKSEEYVNFVNSLPGMELSKNSADSLSYMVGELRYNEGSYEKAIAGFNNYLDKYPNGFNKIKAIYLRAESNTLLKNYTSALEDYERLIKLGVSEHYISAIKKAALISYNHEQLFTQAYTYYDMYYTVSTDENDKYAAALGSLRSGFRISNADAIKKYGNIVANHVKATPDEKSTAHYYLGKTYYKSADWEAAKTAFTKASEATNNNQAAESRYLIAEILMKQNKVAEAEKQCNLANDKNALYPFWIAKSLILMSDIYVSKNDLFNARAALEAVLENFPDNAELVDDAKKKLKIVESLETQNNRIKPANKLGLELINPKGN